MRSRYSYYSYLEGQDQHAAAGYMVSVKAISPTAKPKPSTHLKPYNPPPPKPNTPDPETQRALPPSAPQNPVAIHLRPKHDKHVLKPCRWHIGTLSGPIQYPQTAKRRLGAL